MELQIKNYMEECVMHLVEDVMKANNMCTCERCKMDVMAIALNNLPTKYIVTKSGEMYLKLAALQSQFNVDVITELTKAVQIVKANQRH